MDIITIISISSPLIPLLVGFKHKKSLLWLYPMAGLLADITLSILKRISTSNFKIVPNIFALLEFLLISFIYRKLIFRNNIIFYSVVCTLSLFFVVHSINSSLSSFNMFGISIFFFAYIIYSIVGFTIILKEQRVILLDKSWFFWLNTAFLIFASGSFLLFLFRDTLYEENKELYMKLWKYLFLSINILKNILLAVALYHYKPKEHEPL